VFGELDPGTGAGVEVLTMHKAKGLEFPVVVLADLAGAPVSSAVTLCERATGRLEFRLPGAREVATPGWDEAWEREKLRRDAEEVRLLYVAMTRARDHLVLSWPEGKGGFLSTLPDRLGVAAGVAAQAEDLFTIRAADLPAVGETDRLHRVDVEAALGIARRRGGPDLFAAPDAEESPAAPLLRVTPATVLAGETEDEEHVGPTDERRPAAWSAAEFGTFLHRCLEIVDASADGARTVDTVIARGEWPTPGDDERDVLRSELTRILADPALAPFLAAVADGRIERELPFILPHGSEWMSGTIDAVWEAEDGIVLVDFKSGRRSIGADGRPHARDEHVRQLSLYARALQDLAWGPVREARLLYLGGRPVHSVTVSIPGAVPAS
jgi:ATP-dependent helicase/nuclease subunit A